MTDPLELMPLMTAEHNAWGQVVMELGQLVPNLDVNAPAVRPLMSAMELWGEYLVALRTEQDPGIRARALQEHQDAYERIRS